MLFSLLSRGQKFSCFWVDNLFIARWKWSCPVKTLSTKQDEGRGWCPTWHSLKELTKALARRGALVGPVDSAAHHKKKSHNPSSLRSRTKICFTWFTKPFLFCRTWPPTRTRFPELNPGGSTRGLCADITSDAQFLIRVRFGPSFPPAQITPNHHCLFGTISTTCTKNTLSHN